MIQLFEYHLSTDCYKVRLFLKSLNVEWVSREVEFYPRREHRAEWFLEINPRGELPVIDDDGVIVEDAQEILLYLARTRDTSMQWYPRDDKVLIGQMSVWLSYADALTQTASAARLHDGFMYSHIDVESCRAGARELFAVLDEHLWFGEQESRAWICSGTHPTIADIACFPDIMLAEEGGISLQPYPAIRRWTDRFKVLPGFLLMPGIFGIGPEMGAFD
jgi:glutathione S-transferase